jgi:hypothetical protein
MNGDGAASGSEGHVVFASDDNTAGFTTLYGSG